MAGTLWKAAFVLSLAQAAIRLALRFRYSNTTIHLVVTFRAAPFTVQLATRAFTGLDFFGDWCSGRPWAIQRINGVWQSAILYDSTLSIIGFSEDESGQLWVSDYYGGAIYPIVEGPPRPVNLSVAQTESADPSPVGNPLTYTLYITNNGSAVATGVVVNDNWTSGVAFVSVTSDQGTCSQSGDSVSCRIPSLAAGAVATVTLVLQPSAPGTIVNSATGNANDPDSDPTDNSATEDTTITSTTPTPMPSVTPSSTPTATATPAPTATPTPTPTPGNFAGVILATEPANLKGYWKCNETSGTTLADSSGNSKNLTITGAINTNYWLGESGEQGTCLRTDGVAGYASRNDAVIPTLDNTNFTFFALFKGGTDFGSDAAVSISNSTATKSAREHGRERCNRCGLLRLPGGPLLSLTTTCRRNGIREAWHSVTFRRNATAFDLFVDGTRVASTTATLGTGSTCNRTSLMHLLRSGTTAYAKGSIQHAAIWNRALSDSEIVAIQTARTVNPTPTPTPSSTPTPTATATARATATATPHQRPHLPHHSDGYGYIYSNSYRNGDVHSHAHGE